ncbi:MAG: hypothetical protein K1564_11640 [Candidatus Thiodiazotropha sp. (ex. Lucinisca nassula)]|nr:hypothetical protein [Candidatus Thiodiazotropha sp. (ex. Lucinisca nassula)]
MEEISKQYKMFGLLWLEIAVILQFFIVQVLWPSISQGSTSSFMDSLVFFVLANSTLYIGVAGLPLLWFEKKGWKIFHRQLNISGKWNYKIVYYEPETKHLRKEGQEQLIKLIDHLTDNHGEVWIRQGVFGVNAQQGVGILGESPNAMKATWKGTSVSVEKDGKVLIYFQANLGGIKFSGLDDLTVCKTDDKQQPVEMFGHFHLLPEGLDFVLRGEVTYYK